MEKKLLLDYLLRPHWPMLAVAFVAIVFEGIADLLEPWPIKIVLDYVIASKLPPQWLAGLIASSFGADKFAMLNLAVAVVVAVAVVGAVSTYTEKYLTTKVGQEVMCDLRRAVYHHIQRLSLSFYDRSGVGDLISRVTVDIDAIQEFVSSALLGMVVDSLKLAGLVALMFYLNWRFTLIALPVAPVLFVEVYSLTRRIKSAARDLRKKESEIVSVVEESLSSIRAVKAFTREDYEEKRLDRESRARVLPSFWCKQDFFYSFLVNTASLFADPTFYNWNLKQCHVHRARDVPWQLWTNPLGTLRRNGLESEL